MWPVKEPPSAVSAWASVGHVATPVVAAAAVVVLTGGAVVDGAVDAVGADVGLVVELELPELQAASTTPATRAPTTVVIRLVTRSTIRRCRRRGKGGDTRFAQRGNRIGFSV